MREGRENEMVALSPARGEALVRHSEVGIVLRSIRPAWKDRSLIERVQKILPVDPSSACQRLFNAAVHDLREKVIVAGLDIAKEAAKAFNLPPIEEAEDVEEYSTAKLIDLSYRMGLLSRPEWRRLHRAYEIRRDLEHEDDEYEAGLEDCVYIFKTTVEIVLSRDPIQPLRVTEVKEIVESTDEFAPSSEILNDYQSAPQPRQEEICKYLVSTALAAKQPDVIRQRAVEMLRRLEPITHNQARLNIAAAIQGRIGRQVLDLASAKVAHAIGAMPYLKRAQLGDFFERYYERLDNVGFRWTANEEHGKLLGDLEDVGGLRHCPEALLTKYITWLVLAYVGEPGGYGMGINRAVFFSNVAAPIIWRLFEKPTSQVKRVFESVSSARGVKAVLQSKHIECRLERLTDQITGES